MELDTSHFATGMGRSPDVPAGDRARGAAGPVLENPLFVVVCWC